MEIIIVMYHYKIVGFLLFDVIDGTITSRNYHFLSSGDRTAGVGDTF